MRLDLTQDGVKPGLILAQGLVQRHRQTGVHVANYLSDSPVLVRRRHARKFTAPSLCRTRLLYLMGRTETAMPKIRTLIAGFTIALVGALLTGVSPAHADMVSKGCDYAVSGWSNAKVCITVTYHQPTASKYQIDRIRVEATDIADTKRVEFSLILWDDGEAPGWDRLDQRLNPDNGWDKVYTPTDLYVTVAGSNDGITCWGNAFFDAGGSAFFSTGAVV